MSSNKIQLIAGILIIITPFLGFPSTIKSSIFIGIGCVLVCLSVASHIRRRSYDNTMEQHEGNI